MDITLKAYEYHKVEKESKVVSLPEEPTYYFETFIRRAIRMIPIFTTWNMEQKNEPEYIYRYHFTCVYRSMENKIESFCISVNDFENMYYSEKQNLIKGILNDELLHRTKENFEGDLQAALEALNEY